MISDDFSISLLNPESDLYRYKSDKYAKMVCIAIEMTAALHALYNIYLK